MVHYAFVRKPYRRYTLSICLLMSALSGSWNFTHFPRLETCTFSTTARQRNWLAPKRGQAKKTRKGRCRVPTGGSTRGTTVIWGDYGLRMRDHDRRVSAAQLAIGAETIKKRLKGERYRLYTRICANIGVFTKGNESRMGTGKGSFDYWASRIAVSRIIFEIKGDLHEKVVKDAFRLAANKLPGKKLYFTLHCSSLTWVRFVRCRKKR